MKKRRRGGRSYRVAVHGNVHTIICKHLYSRSPVIYTHTLCRLPYLPQHRLAQDNTDLERDSDHTPVWHDVVKDPLGAYAALLAGRVHDDPDNAQHYCYTSTHGIVKQQCGFKSSINGNVHTAVYVCLTSFLADIFLVSFRCNFCQ